MQLCGFGWCLSSIHLPHTSLVERIHKIALWVVAAVWMWPRCWDRTPESAHDVSSAFCCSHFFSCSLHSGGVGSSPITGGSTFVTGTVLPLLPQLFRVRSVRRNTFLPSTLTSNE